ncbi:PREDICTED: uncharacterized protein LOC109172209 [Ipomoea nil]|uniref:uncharacterized protein LOC109172209 n=1 Tax=Ipomoea nil TaxID=35883 RepID=UPI000901C112|nr:PREDICTED: uncharacterized protein LOC109172209 [Ipomoea nil]
MHLAVGRATSRDVWLSITAALGSSTRARCLNLLGQFQSLRQGDSSAAEYLGRAQLLVEQLSQAGRPMSLDEQNLYVFRGLIPEFRAVAASLTVTGSPVTIPQLADFLQAQEFIYADEFLPVDQHRNSSPVAMYAGQGQNRRQNSNGGGRGQHRGRGQNRGRGGRGQNRGGGGGSPRCQICRCHGHTAVYFSKRYNTQPPAPSQAHVATTGDDGAGSALETWFPDTGATAHATPDSGMIDQAEEYTRGDVLRVGNGTGLGISSVGHAFIPSVSKNLKLSNILHVPKLSVPLLSVHRFTSDNAVFFEFHNTYFVVKDSITKESPQVVPVRLNYVPLANSANLPDSH